MSEQPKITFLGFGEAGAAFATGWENHELQLTAFDIKTRSEVTRAEMLARYSKYGVRGCEQPAEAVRDCDAIFSLVTADQAHEAAMSVVGKVSPGTLFLDCNSCAPDTKRASAKIIDAAGGRYVDVAVMAPVHTTLHQTSVLICGPHCTQSMHLMEKLEMNVSEMEGDIGAASATKMVRSIMIKGLEATMLECVLAARKAGVDETVLDSLDRTFPGFNFRQKAAYMLERVMLHGTRRAAEMREVALTIDQLGLNNTMTLATVECQQRVGELKLDPGKDPATEGYGQRADRILDALAKLE